MFRHRPIIVAPRRPAVFVAPRYGAPLLRAATTTAVVAGTAAVVGGAVSHHQQQKYAAQAAQQQQAAEATAYEQQQAAAEQQAQIQAAVQQQMAAQPAIAPAPTPVAPTPPGQDMMTQLERLAQMKQQGLLTDQEFAIAKSKLLGAA